MSVVQAVTDDTFAKTVLGRRAAPREFLSPMMRFCLQLATIVKDVARAVADELTIPVTEAHYLEFTPAGQRRPAPRSALPRPPAPCRAHA
jgi:hypothetical protein